MMFLGFLDDIGDFFISIPYFLRKMLRILLSLIDGLIYTLDAELYDLVLKIANVNIIKDSTINAIAGRVYQLLALIMIFRIIFVSVTYIMNPEAMLDKAKGYGNIAKKIIITLGLIIVVPWGFRELRNVQAVILDDNVIEYFVFGNNNRSMASAGYSFMQIVGKQFITPYRCTDSECKDWCNQGEKEDTGKPKKSVCQENTTHRSNELCTGDWTEDLPVITSSGNISSSTAASCGYGLGNSPDFARDMYKGTVTRGGKYDLLALMRLSTYSQDYTGVQGWFADFYTDYNLPFIGSTLVGLAIGYMLVIICIDVAVRSVKLSFFEMIAPIPIVSYIGFKDGKETMLNKWFNMVIKTYGLLFIRLAGLQIAFLFLEEMMDSGLNSTGNIFVTLFLIIGVLTFAKEVPQILKDLGISFEGGSFNLKKKISEPLQTAQSITRPVTGLAAGTIAGMHGNYAASRAAGKGVLRSMLSGAGGALTGAYRGTKAAASEKKGFGFRSSVDAAHQGAQTIMKNKDTTMIGRARARAQQRLGMDTDYDKMKKKFDSEDKVLSTHQHMTDEAEKRLRKGDTDAGRRFLASEDNIRQYERGFDKTKESVRITRSDGSEEEINIAQKEDDLRRRTETGFHASRKVERKRAHIDAEIARGYQMSEADAQLKAQLDARRSRGFQEDRDVETTVTYKNAATGAMETTSYSLNNLEAKRDSLIASGGSTQDIETLNNAITAARNAQRTTWETQLSADEAAFASDQTHKSSTWLSNLKRNQTDLAREEEAERSAWEAENREIQDAINAGYSVAQQQHNETLARLREEHEQLKQESIWTDIFAHRDDAGVQADVAEINRAAKKAGISGRIDLSEVSGVSDEDRAKQIMTNTKATVIDPVKANAGERVSDEFIKAQKTKEASTPKGGK